MCRKHPNSPDYIWRGTRRCAECRRINSQRHHAIQKPHVAARKKAYYAAHPTEAAAMRAAARRAGYRKWRQSDNAEPPHQGSCPICTQQKLLVYDHDHRAGSFRGWICSDCNCGLGMFKDSPQALRQAALYLEQSLATQSLPTAQQGTCGLGASASPAGASPASKERRQP